MGPASADDAAPLFRNLQIVDQEKFGVGAGNFLRPPDVSMRPAKPVVVDRQQNVHRLTAGIFGEIPPGLVLADAPGADIGLTASQFVSNIEYGV